MGRERKGIPHYPRDTIGKLSELPKAGFGGQLSRRQLTDSFLSFQNLSPRSSVINRMSRARVRPRPTRDSLALSWPRTIPVIDAIVPAATKTGDADPRERVRDNADLRAGLVVASTNPSFVSKMPALIRFFRSSLYLYLLEKLAGFLIIIFRVCFFAKFKSWASIRLEFFVNCYCFSIFFLSSDKISQSRAFITLRTRCFIFPLVFWIILPNI